MTATTLTLRVSIAAALLTGTVLLAGCGHADRETKTTTTEQTTSTRPATAESSTTTTTTRQTQP
jgi:hypothetical protein